MMGGFGFGGFGMILWIVVLGLVVWAVVSAATRRESREATDSARAVLDGRLARGELTIEEYEKLRATLRA